MKSISTHVLDLALGKPARGIDVSLERQRGSDWSVLTTDQTDQDGRCAQLLPEKEDLTPGIYRLAFDTGAYHQSQKIESLYPRVEITFQVRSGEQRFHIPLLLSPNGYTTYRGS